MSRINQQRQELTERESTICSLSTQLEEATARIGNLEASQTTLQTRMESAAEQYQAEIATLNSEIQFKRAEVQIRGHVQDYNISSALTMEIPVLHKAIEIC